MASIIEVDKNNSDSEIIEVKGDSGVSETYIIQKRQIGNELVVTPYLCREGQTSVRHGIAKIYDIETGALKKNMRFENDLKEGKQIEYYDNGNVKEEVTFKNDKADGIKREFDEEGNLIIQTSYREGMKDGKAVSYNPETGLPFVEMSYNEGELDGPQRAHSLENGRLDEESVYNKGTVELVKDYDISFGRSRLVSQTPYNKDGEIHGMRISYHDNGEIWITPYLNGKQHGLAERYTKKGEKINEVLFKDGKEVHRKDYREKNIGHEVSDKVRKQYHAYERER